MTSRKSILRKIIKSLNGSIETLSNLERDPPIIPIANMVREGTLDGPDMLLIKKESMKIATMLNDYKRSYWKMEMLIKQHFLDTLKKKGYLPGRSLEVESLKNALPEALIKGDERIWIYSFDHYIDKISEQVGRPSQRAPTGAQIWTLLEKRFLKRIHSLLDLANSILPDVFYLKSRIHPMISDPDLDLNDVRVKRPKVSKVERPVKKVIVIKRPIPLPRKVKRPRKRILKKPDVEVIGPEDMK